MKFNTLLLGFILSFFSMMALAGSGHDHGHGHSHDEINQTVAKLKATAILASFIKDKKFDDSWKSITANSADKKVFQGHKEWVVIFTNKKITDIKKQNLYIFLTLTGEYVAANHSGN